MFGLVALEGMTLSGHPSIINKMLLFHRHFQLKLIKRALYRQRLEHAAVQLRHAFCASQCMGMVYSVEKRITQICAYNLVPHLSPYEKPTCQSDGQVLTVHTVFRLSARKTEHAKLDIKSSNIVKQPKTISHHHIFTEN